MFDVRKFRPSACSYGLVLFVFALSGWGSAQDKDNDKEKVAGNNKEEKEAKGGGNFVKVKGKLRCDRPDPEYSIDVPDRPGHALVLGKRKCMWTEPMVLLGAKTKTGEADSFTERMEGTLHIHSFEVDTLDDGEKLTWQSQGQVLAEKGPVSSKGRWSLMRGTGKFKGIKGGGTYEGTLEADDVLTLELEGVYDPSDMVGEKK